MKAKSIHEIDDGRRLLAAIKRRLGNERRVLALKVTKTHLATQARMLCVIDKEDEMAQFPVVVYEDPRRVRISTTSFLMEKLLPSAAAAAIAHFWPAPANGEKGSVEAMRDTLRNEARILGRKINPSELNAQVSLVLEIRAQRLAKETRTSPVSVVAVKKLEFCRVQMGKREFYLRDLLPTAAAEAIEWLFQPPRQWRMI